MSRSLYIDRDLLETRAAVVEDGRIAEIHIEKSVASARQGEIRAARVTHIANDVQAATVDAGDGISLFLRAADARALAPPDAQGKLSISKLVRRGQMLLVQTGRAGQDGKQARASADVGLAGRYLSLFPLRRGLDAGRRPLPDELAAALDPVAATTCLVTRPAIHNADPDEVVAEAHRLRDRWQAIEAADRSRPGLLHQAPPLIERALTHLAGPDPEAILTPERGLRADLLGLAKRIAPDLADRIELTEASRPLDLDAEIDALLSPEVEAAGIRLTIESTRAMTTIDVDGKGLPVDVNIKAAREIAWQLRLRGIGGPVAVDFVSMGRVPERKKVETALRQAVSRDPEQVDVGTIDRFGIATLVRRRSGSSLAEQLVEPTAAAPGLLASAALARLLRRVERELADVGPLPMRIGLPEALKAAAGDDLEARLSGHLGRPLRVEYGDRPVDAFTLTRER